MEDREGVLMDRVVGRGTLREVGEKYGLSAEGVRIAAARMAEQHVQAVIDAMREAQAEDCLMMLAIPPGLDADHAAALQYVAWLVRELGNRGVEVRLHFREAEGGFAVFVEEVAA